MKRFSSRNNYKAKEVPITIREDAPRGLQEFIIQTAYHFEITPTQLRDVICRIVRKIADTEHNWGEENIKRENTELLENCKWFYVYDLIEVLYKKLQLFEQKNEFENNINDFFKGNGIGYQLQKGKVEYRGSSELIPKINNVVEILEKKGKKTSKDEINEAIKDLSKRPADITGAIQHSMVALECVAKDITGQEKKTLGKFIRHSDILPIVLRDAVDKLWAYSSNNGRHLQEGEAPDFDEAELIVSISASLISYLAKKNFPDKAKKIDDSFFK